MKRIAGERPQRAAARGGAAHGVGRRRRDRSSRTVGRARFGRVIFVLLLSLSSGGEAAAQELRDGLRVEVDGVWSEDHVEVIKVVIEKPEENPEIKGYADRFDVEAHEIHIAPFVIEVPAEADIEDDARADQSYDFEELRPEWRLKIEVAPIGERRLRAIKVDVDRKKPRRDPPVLELEGFIEAHSANADGSQQFTLLGLPVRLAAGGSILRQGHSGPQLVDTDEARPSDQLVLWDVLTIGGEVQLDFEYRDDFDLDSRINMDRTILGTSAILEGLYDLGSGTYLFAKGRTAKDYVIADENDNLHLTEATQVEELNLNWSGVYWSDLTLRVGRQDYDEEREWLYDENLDAVRLIWSRDPWEIEYSWSTYLTDAPRQRDELYNQILMAKWVYARRSFLALYMIDMRDSSRADNSPFYLGVRANSKSKKLLYWFEYSYLTGVDGFDDLDAHALDLGAGYRLKSAPTEPYLYGGWAWGSGDAKATGRTGREYRQTGFQDNNGKFFGVASFRYYGELFRPELANMGIGTLGVGFEPVEDVTVDVLYHWYNQDHAAASIRSSKLREAPSGRSTALGSEVDLVLGVDKLFGSLDVEVDLGYFTPGRAFTTNHHPALWAAVQLEWNF